MVFTVPQPWTKVAHPVSAGRILSMEPASELIQRGLPISPSALVTEDTQVSGSASSEGWLSAVPYW